MPEVNPDINPQTGKPIKSFLEKDKLRGRVPDVADGKLDGVYQTYLEHIGVENNEAIQIALAASPDQRFVRFLEMVKSASPTKIQTKAKQCGIDLPEFQNWFQKAAPQIAIAYAQLKAAGIVVDMAEDALSKDEVCERCDGLGWVAAPPNLPLDTLGYRILSSRMVKDKEGNEEEEILFCRTCPKCRGERTVRVVGDEHARNKVLEIAGVIQKGNKGGVTLVQNFGGASHQSAVQGALSSLTIDIDSEEITDEP